MEALTSALGTPQALQTGQIILALLVSFILSHAIASLYLWSFQGSSYSRGFVHAMVLASIVTCILIMALGNNLARGLGILGTLAIIRFRTQIRDPRDIIFMFVCLGIGIAAGAGTYKIAVLGTAAFCLAAAYLHWAPFASRRDYEGLLRFLVPGKESETPTDLKTRLEDTFTHYCHSAELVALRAATQGESMEYAFQVRLRDPANKPDLLEALQTVTEISELSLVMHRSTVEL
jgi:uncharacterized membrane protein YhiD involved in acid resistance